MKIPGSLGELAVKRPRDSKLSSRLERDIFG